MLRFACLEKFATMGLYTKSGFRLQLQTINDGASLHWLFLPGGPGLGSESFSDLAKNLCLPGNVWYVDYPNDGSNQISKDNLFDGWRDGLIELLECFDNIILVAHSFSGMFILSDPRIEKLVKGLVLLNTSPSNQWMQQIAEQVLLYDLPDVSVIQEKYENNRNNQSYKELTQACSPYFFSMQALKLGNLLLKNLPYSHASYDWALKSFHPQYRAFFIPELIPTLIISGEHDHVTPKELFTKDPQWNRKNITIECIKGEGHFPWLISWEQVKTAFKEFIKRL